MNPHLLLDDAARARLLELGYDRADLDAMVVDARAADKGARGRRQDLTRDGRKRPTRKSATVRTEQDRSRVVLPASLGDVPLAPPRIWQI
jgi:hypothetical protein